MATFRKNESGTTLRVDAKENIASYTQLSLIFTNPSGTSYTKTTANGVAIGSVQVTDDDLGVLEANTYVTYDIEADFLNVVGIWQVYFLYTNTTPTPDDSWPGDPVEFEVLGLTV